jgi:hypothetical protein
MSTAIIREIATETLDFSGAYIGCTLTVPATRSPPAAAVNRRGSECRAHPHRYSRGSVTTPVRALAATVIGEAR